MSYRPHISCIEITRFTADDPSWRTAQALLRSLAVDLNSTVMEEPNAKRQDLKSVRAHDLLIRPKRRAGATGARGYRLFLIHFNVSAMIYGYIDEGDELSYRAFCEAVDQALATPQTVAQTTLRQAQANRAPQSVAERERLGVDEAFESMIQDLRDESTRQYFAVREELSGTRCDNAHDEVLYRLAEREGAPVEHFRAERTQRYYPDAAPLQA